MTEPVSIQGLQEALYANQKRIAALKTEGAFGKFVKNATISLQRYAIGITHVWWDRGGGLRASHRMELTGMRGRIYLDPNAVNPRGQRPAVYGPYEEARGGTHAFYQRTVSEAWPDSVKAELESLGRSML